MGQKTFGWLSFANDLPVEKYGSRDNLIGRESLVND